jgi:hypothetical protein
VSDHYEVVLSLFLSDATPAVPERGDTGGTHRMMAPDPGGLPPGGDIAVPRRRFGTGRAGPEEYGQGLYARYRLLDDDLRELWQIMEWPAPYVETEGYAGRCRAESDDKLVAVPPLFRDGGPDR